MGGLHKAKEEIIFRTNIPEAPWYIVEGNDKKRERLNCIEHILGQIHTQKLITKNRATR